MLMDLDHTDVRIKTFYEGYKFENGEKVLDSLELEDVGGEMLDYKIATVVRKMCRLHEDCQFDTLTIQIYKE